MDENWLCQKLESLKLKEARLSALEEIRGHLNIAPNVERLLISRLLCAPELYDCFEDDKADDSSKLHFAVATDILSICVANLSISETPDTSQLLKRALTHNRPEVRAIALNALLKELKQQKVTPGVKLVSDELLYYVLDALQHTESKCGVPAINILTIVLEPHLNDPSVKDKLIKLLEQSETVKCRVYELAVNLAKRAPATLTAVEFLLDSALCELDNNDVLLQANVFEIFVGLAEQNHGLHYMEKRQVFEVISGRIQFLEQNPFDRILIPGIMKFFGKIAALQPQKIISGYPHMMLVLFECLQSGDKTLLPAALDTLANLSQTQQGKLLIEGEYALPMKDLFAEFIGCLKNFSSDLKNRLFNTLEHMFTVTGTPSEAVSIVLNKWFKQLCVNGNMELLMTYCLNPFPDIKISCLGCVKAICKFKWGITAFKNTAGFLEYLMDRKTEFDKDAKYAKFELIKILAESKLFDTQTTLQLQNYVNDGPYFKETYLDIATDGN